MTLRCVERVASRQRHHIVSVQRAKQVERVPAADRPASSTQRRRVLDVPAPLSVARRHAVVLSRLQAFRRAIGAARRCNRRNKPCRVTRGRRRQGQRNGALAFPGTCTGYIRFSILVRTKRTKIIAIRHDSPAQNIPKLRLRLGLSPRPRWASLQCSPDQIFFYLPKVNTE